MTPNNLPIDPRVNSSAAIVNGSGVAGNLLRACADQHREDRRPDVNGAKQKRLISAITQACRSLFSDSSNDFRGLRH